MFGVLLAGPHGPIQILGVYWPCPPSTAGELHMGLDSKLQQWLHRMAITMAPMDYLRGLIRGRVLRHLGHSTDSAPHPKSLVLGDFNASWDNRPGPHKGLTTWAGSCGLINPFAYVAHTIPYPLASFYAGLRPVGLIDHGFISHSFMGLVTLSALDDGSFWSAVTDHRPILLGLAFLGASPRQLGNPLKRPPWGKVGKGTCYNGTHSAIPSTTGRPSMYSGLRCDYYLLFPLPGLRGLCGNCGCAHAGPSPPRETLEGRVVPSYDVPEGQSGAISVVREVTPSGERKQTWIPCYTRFCLLGKH